MISSGVDVLQQCDACDAETSCHVAERILGDRLQWTYECHCGNCGATMETLGWDETPAEIRDVLLERCGTARLFLQGAQDRQLAAMKTFRDSGASLAEAKTSVESLVTTGLEGTRVEMELLAQRLRARGLATTIVGGDDCDESG